MEFDTEVVVCGGGLAGLCLARQLRREVPGARVTVVERVPRPLPEAAHKVGESSVELGSRYFEHTLGLREYLLEQHLVKNGLRFFPGGGATHALEDRVEIGPPQMPVVLSFQLDRGRFENDLRAFVEEDGATLLEGVGVEDVTLGEGGAPHLVTLTDGRTIRTRWVVDATGRRRLLARKLGLGRPSGHHAHSAWFRVEGRLDVKSLVPSGDASWQGRDVEGIRWLSTNHLMGEGYWLWLIPLSSGTTSVGIVVHGDVHPFESINTLERAMAWIDANEPVLSPRLKEHAVKDFRFLKDYSYTAERVYSSERWAMVGEAGLFVDPFYSPGSDFIALANSYAVGLIDAELRGEPIAEQADFVDWFYRRLAAISVETYRLAAKAYGMPRVLSAKIYWDNFNYWSFVCQYFFQGIHRLGVGEQKGFVDVAQRFASMNLRAQRFFAEWAARASDAPERRHVVMPPIPSTLASLHLDLEKEMSPSETLLYMEEKAAAAEEVLTELLLRAVTELGPILGEELVEACEARAWPLAGLDARLAVEAGERRGRRKRLSKLARDMERTLGATGGEQGSLLEIASRLFEVRVEAPVLPPAE